MRSGYTWFCCCALLISICLCNAATGEISADARRAVEQMRLRHQSAEVEQGKPRMRDLAEQLRKKNEAVLPIEPLGEPVPSGNAEAVSSVETPNPVLPEDAAGQSVDSAPIVIAEKQDPGILAEKYDHEPADTVSANASTRSAPSRDIASNNSDGPGFGFFLVSVLICIVLFQFGAGLIGIDNKKEPGCFSFIGLLILVCGVLLSLATIKSFWPLLLLLGLGAVFGQGKSSGGGCGGCGCIVILMILLCMAF